MKTMREMNRLLLDAIQNVMTDEQLDVELKHGMTTRQLLSESALAYSNILPTEDAVETRPAAVTGHIKAYWHPHGYLSARKPNAEWLPLVLEGSARIASGTAPVSAGSQPDWYVGRSALRSTWRRIFRAVTS